jgi:hypothetical protein
MADKSAWFRTKSLEHVFLNADIPLIGDASGLLASAAAGNLYATLHTAAPASDDQTSNEATYTGYARLAIPRDGTNWEVTANEAKNLLEKLFPTKTNPGTQTITHVSVGVASTGAGKILYSKALSVSLVVAQNVAPVIAAEDMTFTET